jgi:tRNA 2-thiouridine synthesizing protein E
MFDKEGFIRNLDDWSPAVAEQIAAAEGIELTAAHWELITTLRDYYQRFESSPANRALVKFVRQELGQDKGNSIYLMSLFPASPAKLAAK